MLAVMDVQTTVKVLAEVLVMAVALVAAKVIADKNFGTSVYEVPILLGVNNE